MRANDIVDDVLNNAHMRVVLELPNGQQFAITEVYVSEDMKFEPVLVFKTGKKTTHKDGYRKI